MSEIVVTPQQMYELLVKIDRAVTGLSARHDQQRDQIADHESRIRAIEAEEDFSRRFQSLELSVEELKRRVWAFPSFAGVIALVSLGFAIWKG